MQCIMQNLTNEYFCDFILSIGSSCRPAVNLRYNYLREFSAPLDWMMQYSLDTVLHLFRSGFNDFFMEYEIDGDENLKNPAGMLRVNDSLNHIVSIHHFPENIWFRTAYSQFIEKMRYRAHRLEKLLKNSSSIVLISYRNESEEELSDFLMSFSTIYPHLRIRLINIRNDAKKPFDIYDGKSVFDNKTLSYIEYSINDSPQGEPVWAGNTFAWSKILSKYVTAYAALRRNEWVEFRKKNFQVVIYGAGKGCVIALNWLSKIGIEIDGIAVDSLIDNPSEINGEKVKLYSFYPKNVSIIISLLNKIEAKRVKGILLSHGYCNISFIDSNMNLIQTDE